MYIIVPDNLHTNFEDTPVEIPVLIRANYMIETNNVRPVLLVNMPVIYEDKDKEDEKQSSSESESEKSDEYFSDLITNIFKTCIQIKLDEVLNIPMDDVEALTKFRPGFDKDFDIT